MNNDVTIIDVAEEADVSPATVSRVINDTVPVNSDKERRVREAVEKLDYQTNKFAHALRKQQSDTVGILVPDLSNPFFATLIRGAENQIHKTEKSGLVGDANSKTEQEGEYVDTLLREQVDGVILISSGENSQKLKKIQDTGIPLVAADRDPNLNRVSKVLADNYRGGVLAGNHLLDQGYENVGFIKGPSDISSAVARYEGFKDSFDNHKLELDERFVFQGDFSFEGGKEAAEKLLEDVDENCFPFGLVAADDLMALGVMRAVENAGLNIPEDFGIIGFDNILMAKLVNPPLTTVSIPAYQIGEEAARILLDDIERKSEGKNSATTEQIFDVNLVVRESSKIEG